MLFHFSLAALALGVALAAFGAAPLARAQDQVPAASASASTQMAEVKNIDAAQLAVRIVGTDKPYLVDVREPHEYAAGHIDGAKLVPLSSLAQHLSEVPRGQPVVVYCRSGHRSVSAYEILREAGYTNIENLVGGYRAWSAYEVAQGAAACKLTNSCT